MNVGTWSGHFIVFDLDGVTRLTGLTDNDCTKELLYSGGSVSAASVVVSEIGNGVYGVRAELTRGGFWTIAVTVTATGQVFTQDVDVTVATAAASPRLIIRTHGS